MKAHSREGIVSRVSNDAEADWSILLALLAILVIIFSWLGFSYYRYVDQTISAPIAIDRSSKSDKAIKDMREALKRFESIQNARSSALYGSSIPEDPSR